MAIASRLYRIAELSSYSCMKCCMSWQWVPTAQAASSCVSDWIGIVVLPCKDRVCRLEFIAHHHFACHGGRSMQPMTGRPHGCDSTVPAQRQGFGFHSSTWKGLLCVQYGGRLGLVGNGIDLFVAGALSAASCALSFLCRCHIEVFRSWLMFLGATHVFVVHRRHC